jgi:DNA topoisomerase-1
VLGTDPETGFTVSVKKGPYGHYVQLGDSENGNKPKRVALPRSMNPADVDLDTALRLLALPREIGRHPESGETIIAGIGRFGPYLKYGKAFASIGADDDVLTIGLNRAVTVIAEASGRGRRTPQVLREIGEHPEGGTIAIYRGRYGPYVGHDGTIASLPKGANPDTLTLDAAVELLAVQKAKGKGKRPGRKTAAPAKAGNGKSTAAKANGAKKPKAKAATAGKTETKPRSRAETKAAVENVKSAPRRATASKRAATGARAKPKPATRTGRATGTRPGGRSA